MSLLRLRRQDASAASTSLHSQVEKLKGELAVETTSIAALRQSVSAAAQQEAHTVAQLQGQVRRACSKTCELDVCLRL